MKTSIKEIIFKQCVWVFASFALHGFRENMFALWGFGARKLQDLPQFAAYKMQKKKKNYQNVTLFISYQPYMYVRTSQMRAN